MTEKKELDAALNKLTYGFQIITTRKPSEELATREKDYIAAGTVSWAMQTSMEPPMITIALHKESDLAETVARSKVFNVHTLSSEEENIAAAFDGDSNITPEEINDIGYELSKHTEAPILNKVGIAIMECRVVEDVVTEGDHMLFIGYIENAIIRDEKASPLHNRATELMYSGI